MLKIITHGTNCIKIIASFFKSAQVPRTYFVKCKSSFAIAQSLSEMATNLHQSPVQLFIVPSIGHMTRIVMPPGGLYCFQMVLRFGALDQRNHY